ncbi:uncharacterized protein LOC109598308 isoform X2 [Aethina tumida]|uniref:uncharacterized protein LOC109598308 isoform X2 n=1 Tax=Aethina tumida TaxID=116153 RepID=UPI00096B65ED|nr:uncharacterized protein LOC109598308 isoform X2 [Aethina tumida]
MKLPIFLLFLVVLEIEAGLEPYYFPTDPLYKGEGCKPVDSSLPKMMKEREMKALEGCNAAYCSNNSIHRVEWRAGVPLW